MDLYDRSTLVQLDCAQKLTRGGSQKVGRRAMEPSCAVIPYPVIGLRRRRSPPDACEEQRQAANGCSESLSVSYCVRWHLAAPWCSRHWAPPFLFDNKPMLDLFEFFQRGQIV